jgi:hypothetical protein
MENYSYVSQFILLSDGATEINPLFLSDTSTNEQKKDWFLRLNPNGNHLLYS